MPDTCEGILKALGQTMGEGRDRKLRLHPILPPITACTPSEPTSTNPVQNTAQAPCVQKERWFLASVRSFPPGCQEGFLAPIHRHPGGIKCWRSGEGLPLLSAGCAGVRMGADSPTEGPLNPWKGKQWRSWLLARGGPWQAVTRLLAAEPGPNGPAPTHSPELHLDGKATFGSLLGYRWGSYSQALGVPWDVLGYGLQPRAVTIHRGAGAGAEGGARRGTQAPRSYPKQQPELGPNQPRGGPPLGRQRHGALTASLWRARRRQPLTIPVWGGLQVQSRGRTTEETAGWFAAPLRAGRHLAAPSDRACARTEGGRLGRRALLSSPVSR